MAKIPLAGDDPTLLAVDAALLKQPSWRSRAISISSVGKECGRAIWYAYRWVKQVERSARLIKAAANGHVDEPLMAERLRLVEGVDLQTVDPATGKQFLYTALDGHLKGYCDGHIIGLLQAAKTPHVWEHKSREEKYLRELQKLKATLGEKQALKAWSAEYYGQAQLYMHFSGLTRHYLTCSTPGLRECVSVRTDYDPVYALALVERARRIKEAHEAPPRIGDADHFVCRMCDYRDICHERAMPERNCRTCVRSTPAPRGRWECERWAKLLTHEEEAAGCPTHLFLPSLVPAEQIDATEDSITYRLEDGSLWVDAEGR